MSYDIFTYSYALFLNMMCMIVRNTHHVIIEIHDNHCINKSVRNATYIYITYFKTDRTFFIRIKCPFEAHTFLPVPERDGRREGYTF